MADCPYGCTWCTSTYPCLSCLSERVAEEALWELRIGWACPLEQVLEAGDEPGEDALPVYTVDDLRALGVQGEAW